MPNAFRHFGKPAIFGDACSEQRRTEDKGNGTYTLSLIFGDQQVAE